MLRLRRHSRSDHPSAALPAIPDDILNLILDAYVDLFWEEVAQRHKRPWQASDSSTGLVKAIRSAVARPPPGSTRITPLLRTCKRIRDHLLPRLYRRIHFRSHLSWMLFQRQPLPSSYLHVKRIAFDWGWPHPNLEDQKEEAKGLEGFEARLWEGLGKGRIAPTLRLDLVEVAEDCYMGVAVGRILQADLVVCHNKLPSYTSLLQPHISLGAPHPHSHPFLTTQSHLPHLRLHWHDYRFTHGWLINSCIGDRNLPRPAKDHVPEDALLIVENLDIVVPMRYDSKQEEGPGPWVLPDMRYTDLLDRWQEGLNRHASYEKIFKRISVTMTGPQGQASHAFCLRADEATPEGVWVEGKAGRPGVFVKLDDEVGRKTGWALRSERFPGMEFKGCCEGVCELDEDKDLFIRRYWSSWLSKPIE